MIRLRAVTLLSSSGPNSFTFRYRFSFGFDASNADIMGKDTLEPDGFSTLRVVVVEARADPPARKLGGGVTSDF